MTITDDMIERAEAAVWKAETRNTHDLVRAALTAALGDVEPLESVLDTAQADIGYVFFRDGEYHAGLNETSSAYKLSTGTGPTIDAAIRNAVANAKGDTP